MSFKKSSKLEKNSKYIIRSDGRMPDLNQIKSVASLNNGESASSVNNRMDPSGLYLSCSTEETVTIYGHGKEYKKIIDNNDIYEGEVLLNNLHGKGFYQTQKNGRKEFYNGQFYLNKLEGYSQIFYENGTYFQGLFKQHRRYGPGVLTYPNGSQDVGFWDGFMLIRLSSVVGSETVPRLATTVLGKAKLLCYRNLVPLCNETDYVLKSIFKDMEAPDEVLKHSSAVLNSTIRNSNSLFFHKKLFDFHFFEGQDCTIKVALDENDSSILSEEEQNGVSEENFSTRIDIIKIKIKEIDECLKPYVDIKNSLQGKINHCTQCCATVEDSIKSIKTYETSNAIILNRPSPVALRKPSDDIITLDLRSLMPDESMYDPSIASSNNDNDSDFEKSFQEISIASSKQHIIDFCVCDEQEIDDLQHLESQMSNIIKQETFYRNIQVGLQERMNSMIEKEEKKLENPPPKFKLVEVTELWAWNNEELLIRIQKHCFKHRNSEEMVNFNVPDLILGNRKNFGKIGEYEDVCHKFLTACSKGRKDFVRRCLRENINPNLTDARGNSGIYFAAAEDQIEIISILTNFGAKLDQINDDELTPLSLCILKYLSHKNQCTDWEKAFLPETQVCTIPNLPTWYQMKSSINPSSSTSTKRSDSIGRQSSQNDLSNARIVELFRRLSTLQQKRNSFIRNVPNTSYVLDLNYKESPNTQVDSQNNNDLLKALKATHLTIMTLLDYRADPNVAKVPYPPLVLSLFSENVDMVTQLLQANANVDIRVTDDDLSCLHVLCSLSCSENTTAMCRLLLLFKCDPNLKTAPTHWKDRKAYFRGHSPEELHFEDYGKNALHLLCMRKDFESDMFDYFGAMCTLLIKGGIDCSETYLGHTPLSLAVLAGNIRLVKYLIIYNLFDPYQNLAYNMGNVLTLFALKRFENTLPTDKCKAMLTALFESNVNVLRSVGDSENAIAFAEEDTISNLKTTEEKKGGNKVKTKPAAAQKNSQSAVMKEFLKELARGTIIKEIQVAATQILYDFTEENMLEETKIAIVLAEFLNPDVVVNNLEVFFQSGKMDFHRLDREYIRTLLNFVNLHMKIIKVKKPVTKTSKGKKDDTLAGASTEDKIEHLLLQANFKKSAVVLPKGDNVVLKPGFDNPEIYKVCFHCLKGRNKELKLCPRCQMIRFCSAQCNKLNLKVKTQHTCNLVFYDVPEERIKEMTQNEALLEMASTARKTCSLRLQKKREEKLYQEEEKLLEMWRADKYGTGFFKFKPLLQKLAKDRTTELGVNLDGIIKVMERNFKRNPADFQSYSVEGFMNLLNSNQKITQGRKSARSSLGTRLGSRAGSAFWEFETYENKQPKEKDICKCKKIKHAKQTRKPDRAKKCESGQTKQEAPKAPGQKVNEFLSTQFEDLYGDVSVKRTRSPIRRKLKNIPLNYQKFIEIMGTYFPEVDMSYWLLPYACCSNGQLFYKFCDNDIFTESYSLS